MLRGQNIDRCTVMDVFSEIDETEYLLILTGELQKKCKTIRGIGDYEKKGKLFRFAASRGFEPEIINEAISKLIDV
jgi:regulatory protein